jgi:hypothetical protein
MWLCSHYSTLIDVWRNHLLSFLMPSAVKLRMQHALTEYELKYHFGTGSNVMLHSQTDALKVFWLTDRIVCTYMTKRHNGCPLPFVLKCIKHFHDDGSLHCNRFVSFSADDFTAFCVPSSGVSINIGMDHDAHYFQWTDDEEQPWVSMGVNLPIDVQLISPCGIRFCMINEIHNSNRDRDR